MVSVECEYRSLKKNVTRAGVRASTFCLGTQVVALPTTRLPNLQSRANQATSAAHIMWILDCEGDAISGRKLWLKPGSEYVVGRSLNALGKSFFIPSPSKLY